MVCGNRFGDDLILNGEAWAFRFKDRATDIGRHQMQTRQVLENIKTILEAGGARLEDVVKTTIFLTDLDDWAAMNEVYREYFVKDPPLANRSPKKVRAGRERGSRGHI